jgi:hypothetical protein
MYCVTKTVQPFRLASVRKLNLHAKHNTKYETMGKIKGKQVVKLWSNCDV